jgi:NAD(P)-dependent dehydrogenase (short-subunit alcohol dehydrogenase family)
VTGASQGIGAGAVTAFLDRGYRVVANSRNITKSAAFATSDRLALVDGDIGDPATAAKIAETAIQRFGTIDLLLNNAGIFFSKPFVEYTQADFESLIATNVAGFLYVTQRAIQQMLAQKSGGSIINVTTTMAQHPIAGIPSAVPMITKGGLESVTRSLAIEYAKQGIRVNAVAPGVVETPMHEHDDKEVLKGLSPMGRIISIADVVDAIVYLAEAPTVTGEILHVDGGSHAGKW